MHYASILIPAALIGMAGTVAGLACTAAHDDGQPPTQTVRASVGPPGNNGTVKIQELGDIDSIPDNDPHVACGFHIEFRGFDEGDLTATWSLFGQPPSGPFIPITTDNVVPIGEDPAGGAPDLDALVTVNLADYDLSGLEEHPQQGFHVKLEVHAQGSIGADKKFKVFWVEGCGGTTSSSGSTTSSSGSTTSSSGSTTSSSGSTTSSSGTSGRTW